MRKTTEKCPECNAPLYLRSVAIGGGLRVERLECQAAGCEWRGDETVEDDR